MQLIDGRTQPLGPADVAGAFQVLGVVDPADADADAAELEAAHHARRVDLHPRAEDDDRCRRLRRARAAVHPGSPRSWPRDVSAYDLLGLSADADDDLLRPALEGRLRDLSRDVASAVDQVSWCMARSGFNTAWTAHGGADRDALLSRLPAFGVRPSWPNQLQCAAAVWAYGLLSDADRRATHVDGANGTDPAPIAGDGSRGGDGWTGAPPAPDGLAAPASRADVTWRHSGADGRAPAVGASAAAAAAQTPSADAPAPTPATPAGEAARRLLGLSPLTSPGVVEVVADRLLEHLHARDRRAANRTGAECERLDHAFAALVTAGLL